MRYLFVLVAAIFALVGVATSVWISSAVFDDPFTYGRNYLWNATDVGSLSFSDTVYFFSNSKIEHYPYPALTMTMIAGAAIRMGYAAAAVLGETLPYEVHVVTHHRLYFALCSFLSTIAFLAATQPMYRIARRVVSPSSALAVCSLYLCAVPTLLYINRFSPEGYLLYFGLWSIELSLVALDGNDSPRTWLFIAASTVLSLLAKPLMAPIVILVAVGLLFRVTGEARIRWAPKGWASQSAFWGVSILIVGVLSAKLPVGPFVDQWISQLHNRGEAVDVIAFLKTEHQESFVAQNAVLLLLGIAGVPMFFRQAADRRTALVLIVLACMMIIMIARRPDWHYMFGFYWILLLLAHAGVTGAVCRWIEDEDCAARVAFLIVVLGLNSWCYWGVATSYKHYHDRWVERREILARDPFGLPAIWEKRIGDSDLGEIFPVRSERLERVLGELRAARSR